MAKIHNVKKRMPVILDPDEESAWLQDIELPTVKSLLKPYPSSKLQAHTIRKDFMKFGGHGQEILEKREYPELFLFDL